MEVHLLKHKNFLSKLIALKIVKTSFIDPPGVIELNIVITY